jgi:hypothetical protein
MMLRSGRWPQPRNAYKIGHDSEVCPRSRGQRAGRAVDRDGRLPAGHRGNARCNGRGRSAVPVDSGRVGHGMRYPLPWRRVGPVLSSELGRYIRSGARRRVPSDRGAPPPRGGLDRRHSGSAPCARGFLIFSFPCGREPTSCLPCLVHGMARVLRFGSLVVQDGDSGMARSRRGSAGPRDVFALLIFVQEKNTYILTPIFASITKMPSFPIEGRISPLCLEENVCLPCPYQKCHSQMRPFSDSI